MPTLAEIDALHARLGSADTVADYLRALAAIGVTRVVSFLADGHSEYVHRDGEALISPPHHEVLQVAQVPDRQAFLEHLRRHRDKETTYLEMSAGLASSGVEKWVMDTDALTITYHDRTGGELLVDEVAPT